jgi:hypothetical protein
MRRRVVAANGSGRNASGPALFRWEAGRGEVGECPPFLVERAVVELSGKAPCHLGYEHYYSPGTAGARQAAAPSPDRDTPEAGAAMVLEGLRRA